MATRKKTPKTHSDDVVREMLKNAALWINALRKAAMERGLVESSVTDIDVVFAKLHKHLDGSVPKEVTLTDGSL